MTAEDLAGLISDLLTSDGPYEHDVDRVSTYAEEGILTSDAGVVVRTRDRAEFQVTVVRSR